VPMKDYLYHGQAVGVDGEITEPGPHKIDGHAKCEIPDQKYGQYKGNREAFDIPGLYSHGGCSTTINAAEETKDGCFRTEVTSTVNNLKVEGGILSIDQITLGIVSVYCRHWYDQDAQRTRVLPFNCKIVNPVVKGEAVTLELPPPFLYSDDRRESYLSGATCDPNVDEDIRQAILGSASRFLHVPNFGRIFYGEWTLFPSPNWHILHQITMVRLLLGSPQTGGTGNGSGQGGGGSTPPKGG